MAYSNKPMPLYSAYLLLSYSSDKASNPYSRYLRYFMPKSSLRKLLLAGAGHAHTGLLRRLIAERPANTEVTLITEEPQTIYSGMLPGWMAGHYSLDEVSIDIEALCRQAGVRFVQGSIAQVKADAGQLFSADKQHFTYDLLSLNTGADTDMRWLEDDADYEANHKITSIRPLSLFVERWQQTLLEAKHSKSYKLAIVGAGAAAVELVMAAQVALRRINSKHQVYLVCGAELLSGFDEKFRQRVIKQLKRHSIKVIYARAESYHDGKLITAGQSLPIDAVIAATGVVGSAWTDNTDLAIIGDGFVAVNAIQQSPSHANVFAVGDVATRVDKDMAHSGVHAVHGGAVVADNLLAYLNDEPMQTYQPRARTLYLLSCGDKYAIGSWGEYSVQGRWVWYLKRQIDKRFIKASQKEYKS